MYYRTLRCVRNAPYGGKREKPITTNQEHQNTNVYGGNIYPGSRLDFAYRSTQHKLTGCWVSLPQPNLRSDLCPRDTVT